jgi:hypothetical protein
VAGAVVGVALPVVGVVAAELVDLDAVVAVAGARVAGAAAVAGVATVTDAVVGVESTAAGLPHAAIKRLSIATVVASALR